MDRQSVKKYGQLGERIELPQLLEEPDELGPVDGLLVGEDQLAAFLVRDGRDAGDGLLVILSRVDLEGGLLHLPLELGHRLHGGAELVAVDQAIAIILRLLDRYLGIFGLLQDATFLFRMQLLAFGDEPPLDAGLPVREPHIILRQLLVGELPVEEATPILERVAAPAPQRALALQELEMLGVEVRSPPCLLLLVLELLARLEMVAVLLIFPCSRELEANATHVCWTPLHQLPDR